MENFWFNPLDLEYVESQIIKNLPQRFFVKTYPNTCLSEKCRNFKIIRSGRPKLFCKMHVLENLAKFTGKHLFSSLFLIKLQFERLQLYRKRGFDIFKNTFLKAISARLFLKRFRNKPKKFFELSHKHRIGNICCDR